MNWSFLVTIALGFARLLGFVVFCAINYAGYTAHISFGMFLGLFAVWFFVFSPLYNGPKAPAI
jgi:hypothetical protein